MVSYSTVITLAIVLILFDFVFATEVLSFISYILLSYVFFDYTSQLSLDSWIIILSTFVCFVGLLTLHYTIIRKINTYIIDKYISKDKIPTIEESQIGNKTKIEIASKKTYIRVYGDLAEAKLIEDGELIDSELIDNEVVIIESFKDGIYYIKRIN